MGNTLKLEATVATEQYGNVRVSVEGVDHDDVAVDFRDLLKEAFEIRDENWEHPPAQEEKPERSARGGRSSRDSGRGGRSERPSRGRGRDRGGDDEAYTVLGEGLEGGEVVVEHEGKFGPYVKERDLEVNGKAVFANVPDGVDSRELTLDDALELLEERVKYMEENPDGGKRGGRGGSRGGGRKAGGGYRR